MPKVPTVPARAPAAGARGPAVRSLSTPSHPSGRVAHSAVVEPKVSPVKVGGARGPAVAASVSKSESLKPTVMNGARGPAVNTYKHARSGRVAHVASVSPKLRGSQDNDDSGVVNKIISFFGLGSTSDSTTNTPAPTPKQPVLIKLDEYAPTEAPSFFSRLWSWNKTELPKTRAHMDGVSKPDWSI
ncbi:hypothetical protein GNI_026580 [Gregarina niphandrodes]|uniref:Uncharacterized protein n=1 Tax=Gregarina niphandrodes TaxID=110365 RepID=A0A023BBL3_GRENI|nr:hypothetical protein GNI_026580 [Gregarina niphandrodes]EZG79407.1 hypothetical protein GNI_026580 [Gregarina niphandrodes]|eukprot:XP_011129054.1 hypothetical protein GNI_026580 [Gregarina niphandrodes]